MDETCLVFSFLRLLKRLKRREERESKERHCVKRQKQTICIHFRTVCRSVERRSSDFFFLCLPFLSLVCLSSFSLCAKYTEKKGQKRKRRSDRKGRRRRRRRFQCWCVRTSKKIGEK